jgi:hypothetical protein
MGFNSAFKGLNNTTSVSFCEFADTSNDVRISSYYTRVLIHVETVIFGDGLSFQINLFRRYFPPFYKFVLKLTYSRFISYIMNV